jgi:glycosyltransferase involved in cell wall biosynthesis
MRPPAPWRILEVDLAKHEGGFNPGIDRPALMILRRHGAVLGRVQVLPSDLPMSAGEFAELAGRACGDAVMRLLGLGMAEERPKRAPTPGEAFASGADAFDRLDAALAARRSRPVPCTGSIIVCTRRRPRDLAACLNAIGPEFAAGCEVIVVDNGPDDETCAVAKRAGARYLAEPRPGISTARNRGITAATGEVAIFVDDDARPEPGWADMLLRRFDDPAVAAVTGLVLPAALETEAQIGFEYDLGFGGMDVLPLTFESGFLDGWSVSPPLREIGAGANHAVRCSHARRLGGFDERLGPGGVLGGFDDTDFWHRALLAGYRVSYEPLAVVRHRHPETLPELRKQAYFHSHGHTVGLFMSYARSGQNGHLRRVAATLPRWHAGRPSQIMWSSLRGYLASLRHLGLLRAAPGPVSNLEKTRDDG